MRNSDLWKQSQVLGKFWGNVKLIAQQGNIYIQIFILGFSAISAFVPIHTFFLGWGYYLPFWQFAAGISLLGIVLLAFEWRMGLPSTFQSWNHQWWSHNNPARREIKEVREQLDRIERKLDADSKRVDEVQFTPAQKG